MVFLTAFNCARSFVNYVRPGGGPDKFWRVQQYLRFAWRFTGRKRNCYRIAIRYVHKALMYGTIGRKLKKQDMRELWNARLEAATCEHGIVKDDFLEALARLQIQLDRKSLSELAVYEPRTFQGLTDIAKGQLKIDGVETYQSPLKQNYLLSQRKR